LGLLLTVWNLYMLIMMFLWPTIWATDMFLRHINPYRRRMQRGKFYRWELRTFGPLWYGLWEFPIMLCLFGLAFIFKMMEFGYIFWTYVGIVCAVDWITGSDDPPYKRWVASLTKKLTISPPPRPVIDLS